MNVPGAGDSRIFAAGSGGAFVRPASDFGSLVQNGDGSYTYTAKDQTRIDFDALGYQTSVVDTDGQVLSYSYDTQNRLDAVLAPDGGLTTLAYDPGSGLLARPEKGRVGMGGLPPTPPTDPDLPD